MTDRKGAKHRSLTWTLGCPEHQAFRCTLLADTFSMGCIDDRAAYPLTFKLTYLPYSTTIERCLLLGDVLQS